VGGGGWGGGLSPQENPIRKLPQGGNEHGDKKKGRMVYQSFLKGEVASEAPGEVGYLTINPHDPQETVFLKGEVLGFRAAGTRKDASEQLRTTQGVETFPLRGGK